MKMIIKDNVYEMSREQLSGVLKTAKKYNPKGIYAIQKDDICELKNEKFDNDATLFKAVKEYEGKGFKVMYKAK